MKVIVPLIIIIALIGAASSCGSGSNKSSAASAAPASKPAPTFAQVLDKNPTRSMKLCDAYNSLVNQGWDDNQIYQDLSDAGTFDQFYGTGRDFFNAMVKWCYQNSY
jgi:hypothetical protein